MSTDKFIKDKPQLVQKTLNALYGGVAFLQNPKNRAEAVRLIAEIDEIPPNIAEAELDSNIVKLSRDGEMQKDWLARALDMGKLIGMTDLAPVEDIYVTNFKPVPTAV
jgi:NitT/TauT family transport system substrate-binding protein